MRRTAGVALAALLTLTGCTDDLASERGILESQPTSTPTSTPRVLAAEAGRQWVGFNDVMVAVPAYWRTATGPCGEPDGPVVHFPGRDAALVDCAKLPTTGVNSLTIASQSSGALPELPRGPVVTKKVNGVQISHTPVICLVRRPLPMQCSMRAAVHDSDTELRVIVRGEPAWKLVRSILRSLAPVPQGYAVVPAVELGTSVEQAKRQLSRVGLAPTSPDVNFPHYATGTRPAAGAVLEKESTVALMIGDG